MTFEEDKNKSLADVNNKLMKEAGFSEFQINTLLANVELIRQDAIKDYKSKVREAIFGILKYNDDLMKKLKKSSGTELKMAFVRGSDCGCKAMLKELGLTNEELKE